MRVFHGVVLTSVKWGSNVRSPASGVWAKLVIVHALGILFNRSQKLTLSDKKITHTPLQSNSELQNILICRATDMN